MMKLHIAQKNPYQGKFVAFEGIDGSGKTTQVKLLGDALMRLKIPILLTKEPTEEGIFGNLVRVMYSSDGGDAGRREAVITQFFQKEEYWAMKRVAEPTQKIYFRQFENIADELLMGITTNLDLFIQLCMTFDRYDHRLRVEIPALREGVHVISDRDFLSLAYGRAGGLDWKMLLTMHTEILETDFIVPDLVIFLDISAERGAQRVSERQKGKQEYFDDLKKAKIIRQTYHDLLAYFHAQKTFRIETIRGLDSVEKIHEKVFGIVAPFLVSAK